MGNTHAIAKNQPLKKHPTLHIYKITRRNSYSAAGYKKPVIIPGNPPL